MMIDNLIIDGNNWLHRIHHATYQHGERVADPMRLLERQFDAVVDSLSSQYIAVAFDSETKGWRSELWPAYKGLRTQKTDAIKTWLRDGEQWLRNKANVECFATPGAEADDIIATLVWQIKTSSQARTVIVSCDKDLYQLLAADQVTILRSFKTLRGKLVGLDWLNHERFEKKYVISPPQWPSWRALVGDTSDGMAGVPSVGEQAATELLQRFHGIDEIVDGINTYKTTGITKTKEQAILREHRNGNLEKWVRIHTLVKNVPLPYWSAAIA